MALFTQVLLVVLLPFIRCDKHKLGWEYKYEYHPEYAFAKCDFAQFDVNHLTLDGTPSNPLEVAPFTPLLPTSIKGVGVNEEADLGGSGDYDDHGPKPLRYISVRLRQRIGKKYGESFPLEIAVHAFLGKLKYELPHNIGLHVREYGVDSYFKGCEAAGEDYNPLKTTHGNIWDHPKKRHVGDWGNVRLTKGEYVDARFNDYLASIDPGHGGDLSILGKSIVLFAREDDLGKKKSDQSTTDGSVGSPILCCAVKMSDGSDFPHDDEPHEPIGR